jgi:hypothetical protein
VGGIEPLGPDQEHHAPPPERQALQPLFAVGFAGVFHGDQRGVKNVIQQRQIDAVLAEIVPTFRLVPGDYQ